MANRYGLQIRAATSADGDGLSELMNAVGHPVLSAAVGERVEAIRQSGHGNVLIAVEWGPPSGVLAFHWYSALHTEMPFAQVDWLAVAPDERRRGIARTLLKSAAQAARMAGCGSLSLAVPQAGDATLQAFCAASGFEPTGTSFTRSLRKTRTGS